jgi:hypothetical protein
LCPCGKSLSTREPRRLYTYWKRSGYATRGERRSRRGMQRFADSCCAHRSGLRGHRRLNMTSALGISLPSKGEACAPHHRPVLASGLTMPIDRGGQRPFSGPMARPHPSPAHTPRAHVHADRRVNVLQSSCRCFRLSRRIFLPNCNCYVCAPTSLPSVFLLLESILCDSSLTLERRSGERESERSLLTIK